MSRVALKSFIATIALVLAMAAPAFAQLTVTVTLDVAGAQFAGTPVRITATAGGTSDSPVYQFLYRPLGSQTWRLLRDFYYLDHFDWVTLDGNVYEIAVVARINSTGETAAGGTLISITSQGRLAPVILPTAHPLVALYSAPACSVGGVMRVRFRRQGALFYQYTTPKSCQLGKALNFHIAGLRADTNYVVQHEVITTQISRGPEIPHHTGIPTAALPTIAIDTPASGTASVLQPTTLMSVVGNGPVSYPVAADLSGQVTWYYAQPQTTLTRPLLGGNMLVLIRDTVNGAVLREIDLAGNVVRETNAGEVSRQLMAMGHDPIGVFHHEAIRLQNGHTLVIASVERLVTDVQGAGVVNVYGEMIVDLSQNLQVAWAWNAFDHLDVSRAALLGETCTFEGPGCPALYLAPTANDWLHANTIGYVPEDGNLVMSLRHQDWVIKIDYENGAGTGAVIWKAGPEGDFTIASGDSWPWFSHQHDSKLAGGALLVYDNGNTRVAETGSGNSRGQVFLLDEVLMEATPALNLDLGAYSSALGSAQPLYNGNFHFDNGFLGSPAAPVGEALELRPDGSTAFALRTTGFVYRSFRMFDLYRP